MAFVAFGLCCPQGLEQGCRTLGVLSLCCDTVLGGLVLGAGGPWYPQEVLASVLGQAGWEGPQNLVKEQEKGLSQVIFGMKQFVLSSSHDDVSVVVTGQSLLLLQCWVALGHGCHLLGWQGCDGSRGLPGMQGKTPAKALPPLGTSG